MCSLPAACLLLAALAAAGPVPDGLAADQVGSSCCWSAAWLWGCISTMRLGTMNVLGTEVQHARAEDRDTT